MTASEETNKPDVKMTTTTTTPEDQNNGPQLHDSLLDLFSDFDGSKDVCIEAGVRSGGMTVCFLIILMVTAYYLLLLNYFVFLNLSLF